MERRLSGWKRELLRAHGRIASLFARSEVARAENDVFRSHGLGQYVTSEFTRVRGHGIGLFPDQKPHVLEDVTTPLTANMTIIVHPNTYHPDVGYLVLGDTIIVTADGHESLGAMPRNLLSA